MEDLSQEIENKTRQIAELLNDHKGQDVCVLDLRKFQIWTDFFVIVTVSSKTHMDGLEKHIREFCRDREMDVSGSPRKRTEDEWRLLELGIPPYGSIVVHLMSSSVREFYELERLWVSLEHVRKE